MNILFLTHRLPYSPNRGDRIRAYYLLRDMSRFATVSVFSLVHDAEEASRVSEVPGATTVETSRVPRVSNLARGLMALSSSRPLTHTFLNAPDVRFKLESLAARQRPDVVVAYCSGMARFALEPPLDRFPLVLDLVDVDSQKWRSLGERTRWPLGAIYRREARTLEAFETLAARRAKMTLVVNEREYDLIAALAPDANVRIVPNGVDTAAFTPPGGPVDAAVVVFSGVMSYAPNVEAVVWFASHVWPLVRAERPDAKFVVVGADPTPAIAALARTDPSIEVTGTVDAVQPHLWRAAIAIAPIRVSRGVQNKVLEALAAGLPVVVTSAVREGLPAGSERGCLTADDAVDFSRSVVQLLNQPAAARRALAGSSQVESLAWPGQLEGLQGILEKAC